MHVHNARLSTRTRNRTRTRSRRQSLLRPRQVERSDSRLVASRRVLCRIVRAYCCCSAAVASVTNSGADLVSCCDLSSAAAEQSARWSVWSVAWLGGTRPPSSAALRGYGRAGEVAQAIIGAHSLRRQRPHASGGRVSTARHHTANTARHSPLANADNRNRHSGGGRRSRACCSFSLTAHCRSTHRCSRTLRQQHSLHRRCVGADSPDAAPLHTSQHSTRQPPNDTASVCCAVSSAGLFVTPRPRCLSS